jgi:molecular chaperone HtpG
MNSREIVVGKFTLETLTLGMYKNPLVVYREYIQNSSDSIDHAIKTGLIQDSEALIKVNINHKTHSISIEDNGTGVSGKEVYNVLCDIGNARKDYRTDKGFRGIGRLGGLAYCDKLVFKTSYHGEDFASMITWDGVALKELLRPDNHESSSLGDVVRRIVSQDVAEEAIDAHYFVVTMQGISVHHRGTLLHDHEVKQYLSEVAPVPYDHQQFMHALEIDDAFKDENHRFDQYKVILNDSAIPIKKPYKTSFITGNQERTKQRDNVKEIRLLTDEKGRYSGWIAITNFYGNIRDLSIRGIRLRKGNSLIGDSTTFNQFFLAENDVANSWFMGEIFIHDPEVIPNSQRDDFEPNDAFMSLKESLTELAEQFRKEYRRDMSEFNSTVKQVNTIESRLAEIKEEVQTSGVTSDHKREQLLKEKDNLEKSCQKAKQKLNKLISKKVEDEDKKQVLQNIQKKVEGIEKEFVEVENTIIDAPYSTKCDLPSSYPNEVRKVYERIIAVIDAYFVQDIETAKNLRTKIIEELAVNPKSKKRK